MLQTGISSLRELESAKQAPTPETEGTGRDDNHLNADKNRYRRMMEQMPEAFRNPSDLAAGIHIATTDEEINRIEAFMADKLEQQGLPREWAEVGIVYEDQYTMILRDAVTFQPGSIPGTYTRHMEPAGVPGVVVLPVLDGKVCMVRLFRHSQRDYSLELPRGYGRSDETPAESAARELREETGGTAHAMHFMGYASPDTGITGTPVAVFYADLESLGDITEEQEAIEGVVLLDIKEFAGMIKSGAIQDSFTLAAAMKAVVYGHISLEELREGAGLAPEAQAMI